MPKVTTTNKPAKALDKAPKFEENDLPDLDEDALSELESLLESPAGKSVTKPSSKGKVKAVKEVEMDLPPFDLDEDEEPSTDEVEGPQFAGLSARIDSLVELNSDHHNSLSNRIESIQTTLKGVFDLITARLDEFESILQAQASKPAPAQSAVHIVSNPSVNPSSPEAVAKLLKADVALISKVLNAARGLKKPIAVNNFVAWLSKSGLTDAQIAQFGDIFGLEAGEMVDASNFG